MKLYAERDIEGQGEHYVNHVMAMTSENLHGKSNIAAELAHRDIRIAELEAQLEASTKKTNAWREFGQSVGDPFRAKCGHLVNRGWRCLVCGADPTD